MLWKRCTQYASKFEKFRSSGHRTGKGQFSFQSQRKALPKMCKIPHNCTYSTCKVMLEILQVGLNSYMNQEFPDGQAGFRKSRGTRDQIVSIHWIIKKGREFKKKKSTSASLTILKPLTVWITTNCGKFLKRWENQITLLASWETCMQVKRQQFELDMEQQKGSKFEQSTSRLYIVTLLI